MGDQNERYDTEQRLSLPNITTTNFQLPTINIISSDETDFQPSSTTLQSHTNQLYVDQETSSLQSSFIQENSILSEGEHFPQEQPFNEGEKLPPLDLDVVDSNIDKEWSPMNLIAVPENLQLQHKPESTDRLTRLWRQQKQGNNSLLYNLNKHRRGSMPGSLEKLQQQLQQSHL